MLDYRCNSLFFGGLRMFFYVILFVIVGAGMNFFISDRNHLLIGFIAISLIWATVWGVFWALITFGELYIGYLIMNAIKGKTDQPED